MRYRAWGDDSDIFTKLGESGFVEYAQKEGFHTLEFPETALAYFNAPLGSVAQENGNITVIIELNYLLIKKFLYKKFETFLQFSRK